MSIKYFLTSWILALLAVFLCCFLPAFFEEAFLLIIKQNIVTTFLFGVISLSAYFLLNQKSLSEKQRTMYMFGTIVLRLFFALILVLIIGTVAKPPNDWFIMTFCLIYLIFLVQEIIMMLQINKK